MGHEDRKDMQINIDDILENNFLIADFMLVPELRQKLENASLTDLSKLLDHLEDKENVESFANTLKHHYKNYLKNKSPGNYNLELLNEALKELAGLGKYEILFKALYNLFYNYGEQNNAVEQFIKELKRMRADVVLDLASYFPERWSERDKKIMEKVERQTQKKAIHGLANEKCTVELISKALDIPVEEVKEILKDK